MKSTYLNDAWSSTYPFVADAVLPFPMHCIVGAGACVKPNKEQTVCPSVVLTSVEITDTGISAFLCLGDYPLGLVECELSQQRVTRLHTEDWDVTAWLVPGQLDAESTGTYECSLELDAACVQFMPGEMYGDRTIISVNTSPHDVPEMLELSAAGLLDMSFTQGLGPVDTVYNTDLGRNGYGDLALRISGNPDNDVLSVQDTYTDYPMVTSINGVAVAPTEESDYSRTLHIVISAPENKGPCSDWVIAVMSGAVIPYESIITSEPMHEYYDDIRAGWLSDYGVCALLTLCGRGKTPSCYDSSTDDANTWGPNNVFI